MDEMLKNFAMLVSPEQKALEARIAQAGGANECRNDDRKLRALLKADAEAGAIDLDQFKRELDETMDAAMEKNLERFTSKLKIMETNLVRETERIVERSTDRVIDELVREINKGPQNNILDRVRPSVLVHYSELKRVCALQDVYAVWSDMVSQSEPLLRFWLIS
jgi:hypothetical protein